MSFIPMSLRLTCLCSVPAVSALPSPFLKDALELDLLFVIQNFLFSTSLPHSLSVTRSQLVHETHTGSHILYIFITSPQEKTQRNVLLSHPVACKEHSVHSTSKGIFLARDTLCLILSFLSLNFIFMSRHSH